MTISGVWRFLRTFAVIFAAAIAIPASYVALRDADIAYQFYLAIPAVAVVTVVLLYGAKGREWIEFIREYPGLLDNVAELKVEVKSLQASNEAYKNSASEAHELGVAEGIKRVRGAMLATSGKVPEPVAVVEYMGTAAFLCRPDGDSPVLGARYFVASSATDRVLGVVETVAIGDDGLCHLVCVEPRVPKYWEKIVERLEYDDQLPENTILKAFSFPAVDSEPAISDADTESTDTPDDAMEDET